MRFVLLEVKKTVVNVAVPFAANNVFRSWYTPFEEKNLKPVGEAAEP